MPITRNGEVVGLVKVSVLAFLQKVLHSMKSIKPEFCDWNEEYPVWQLGVTT
jgi:hypothetical protein